MLRFARLVPIACTMLLIAGFTVAVLAADGGEAARTEKAKEKPAPPATIADLERAGWKPGQPAVVWLFGGINTPGAYISAPLADLVASARPARDADHVYIVRRTGRINFISEPLALNTLDPVLVPEPGDAVVVTRLGGFGAATTRPADPKK